LRRAEPWLGAIAGGMVFLPVVAWNAGHGWASFLRQGGRVADWQPARAAQFLGELAGGQAGLATPLIFALCVAGTVVAVRQAWRARNPGWSLLAWLVVPGALVFLQHALGDRVQGNWPAVLFPAACIAAAGLEGPLWRRLVTPAVLLGLAVTAIVYVQALTGVIPIPPRLDPVTRQLAGWEAAAERVAAAAHSESAGLVVSANYGDASELAWLLPRGTPVAGIDPRWRLFDLPPAPPVSGDILLAWPATAPPPDPTLWPDARLIPEHAEPAERAARFRLYRITGLPPGMPAALLPRP
jgi:hypothetical protein